MTSIFVSDVINARASDVWDIVRDFNGLPDWHPAISDSRIEDDLPADQIGCIRSFHLTDGGHIREQLLTLSDYDYTQRYSILESPMALENYIAVVRLLPVTAQNSTYIEWSAQFTCVRAVEAELVDTISNGVFQTAFDAIKGKLE